MSLVGAKVRLKRTLRTNGGTTFREGVVMRVTNSHNRGLDLQTYCRWGWGHSIFSVSSCDVEVIEKPKKEDQLFEGARKMNVTLTKELCDAIGAKELKKIGVKDESFRWSGVTINLRRFTNKQVTELQNLLKPFAQERKFKAHQALRDVIVWVEAATKGAAGTKCKNVKQFASLIYEYLQAQPGQRLYQKDDVHEVWRAYYVSDVTWVPQRSSGGHITPEHVTMKLLYMELGSMESESEVFYFADVRGQTVADTLTHAGYIVETPELRATYLAQTEKYRAIHDKVGKQFVARGVGTTNLDGNDRDDDSWSRWSVKALSMVRSGEPSRVVIDIPQEEEKKERRSHSEHVDGFFWKPKSYLFSDHPSNSDSDVDPEDLDPEDIDLEGGEAEVDAEVPIFHSIPCFDLRRHMRLRVHVDNLTEYVYDEKLGEKLILPVEQRALIEMLVQHQGGFKDIIGGKGGGAVILSAGPPGVGKTLTAEVYGEVEKRALYSVQCSQLGTDEDELEEALMKSFARAQRWNAILLLDEADVYVAARGSDLQQNAIVGVFLRVLEYYQGVLFMTTNRADLVDDAIASRCIARLEYQIPTATDQARIWRVLADVAGMKIDDATIQAIVARHPHLSGRDIKQLLKLTGLVLKALQRDYVSLEVVDFVLKFKPSAARPDQQHVAPTLFELQAKAPSPQTLAAPPQGGGSPGVWVPPSK